MFLTNHTTPEPLDNVFIEIGPFTIMWYAVFILTGAITALVLAIQEGKKIGVDRPFLEDLVLFGIPISVVGARLYYVILEWNNYKDNIVDVFKINEGGLAIHGAIISALIWGVILAKKRGYSYKKFLRVIDLGAVGFLIAQAIGRWGNFMNQEAHGTLVPGETYAEQRSWLKSLKIPDFIVDQMYMVNEKMTDATYATGYFHPTFLYESLWNILGFVILLILRRTKQLYVGDLGLIYLMWYGFGRYFIEGMRTDPLMITLFGEAYRFNQVMSIVLFIAGLTILILRHIKKWYPKPYYELLEEHGE